MPDELPAPCRARATVRQPHPGRPRTARAAVRRPLRDRLPLVGGPVANRQADRQSGATCHAHLPPIGSFRRNGGFRRRGASQRCPLPKATVGINLRPGAATPGADGPTMSKCMHNLGVATRPRHTSNRASPSTSIRSRRSGSQGPTRRPGGRLWPSGTLAASIPRVGEYPLPWLAVTPVVLERIGSSSTSTLAMAKA